MARRGLYHRQARSGTLRCGTAPDPQVIGGAGEERPVGGTPFRGLLREREIAVAHYAVKPHGHQVGLHVGEIGVAAIIVGGCVAPLLFHLARKRGEPLDLVDILQYACRGLARQGAEHRGERAVGAETVGVHRGEEHAVASYRVKAGCHRLAAEHRHKVRRKAFKQQHVDIGAPGDRDRSAT